MAVPNLREIRRLHHASGLPFCSERCRLLDPDNWASERYCVSETVVDEDAPEPSEPNERKN